MKNMNRRRDLIEKIMSNIKITETNCYIWQGGDSMKDMKN